MNLPQVKVVPAFIAFVVTCLFWFIIAPPTGVDINAWRLLGIFIGTIVAIIGRALPMGGAAGYVTMGEWWRLGFIVSIINLIVWGLGCTGWWKILGYW